MKKQLLALCALLCAACFFSCSKEPADITEPTETGEKDWHNSIEYEGSFYVNEGTKLLYSLDRGTVTLWDDKGDGSVLQTLKYDSTVDDAIERVEFSDENFDSHTDIKILYDETNGKKYNLWLWNESKGKFDMCSAYKNISDPGQLPDEKLIECTADNGVFGVLNRNYAFDEHMNITEVMSSVIDDNAVADNIAAKLSMGSAALAENKARLEDRECTAFIASSAEGGTAGYLAYDSDGVWYADIGPLGFYRSLSAEGDAVVLGEYIGDAGKVQKAAEANFEGSIAITQKTDGTAASNKACRYTVTADGEFCCYIVISNESFWRISTDGESYKRLNKNTMKIEDAAADAFTENYGG